MSGFGPKSCDWIRRSHTRAQVRAHSGGCHQRTHVHAHARTDAGACASVFVKRQLSQLHAGKVDVARAETKERNCTQLHGEGEVYHDHDDDDEEEDGVTHTQFETR